VPTAGLTNGSVNRSAVYTQLYLGLFSRTRKVSGTQCLLRRKCEGYVSIKFPQDLRSTTAAERDENFGGGPATGGSRTPQQSTNKQTTNNEPIKKRSSGAGASPSTSPGCRSWCVAAVLGKSHSISEGQCRPAVDFVLSVAQLVGRRKLRAGRDGRCVAAGTTARCRPAARSCTAARSRAAARSVASPVRAGGYVAERRGHFLDADNAGIG
jgi:hypothetical protein